MLRLRYLLLEHNHQILDLVLLFLPSSLLKLVTCRGLSIPYGNGLVEENHPGMNGSVFCWSSSSLLRVVCLSQFSQECPSFYLLYLLSLSKVL